MKENQSGNWMIVVKEQNIFGKIKGFFKKLFGKKQMANVQEIQKEETQKQAIQEQKLQKQEPIETAETIEKVEEKSNNGLDNIKVDVAEETRILQLQKQFREGKIKEEDLEKEDIIKLKLLYEKQIGEIKQRIEKILQSA